MVELWKPFPGHPNYLVSNRGRILNDRRGVERAAIPNQNGYLRVSMYLNRHIVTYYVHQLVAELFMEEWRPGVMVTFKNGDRGDCRIENLKIRQTLRQTREASGPRPIVMARRVRIVELDMVFANATAAANYIGGDVTTVYKCLRGERRSHRGYSFETQNTQTALSYLRAQHESEHENGNS